MFKIWMVIRVGSVLIQAYGPQPTDMADCVARAHQVEQFFGDFKPDNVHRATFTCERTWFGKPTR